LDWQVDGKTATPARAEHMVMIIDPHLHLGEDTTFDSKRTEEELLRRMDENGIDAAILQPAQLNDTLERTQQNHDRIHRFMTLYPSRIFGMCSVNPYLDWAAYRGEVNRCVQRLGFSGLKVVAHTHAWSAQGLAGAAPFAAAAEFDVPLMIHGGYGNPWAMPGNFIPLIEQFPNVNVVLAHAAEPGLDVEYFLLLRDYPQVFADISIRTYNRPNIRRFVRELGAHKIMYASDSPDEMAHSLFQCRTAGLTDGELEWCLGKSAAAVYRLPIDRISQRTAA
jgi:predicted TIM-barrel fold metal-dependent hydrolase